MLWVTWLSAHLVTRAEIQAQPSEPTGKMTYEEFLDWAGQELRLL